MSFQNNNFGANKPGLFGNQQGNFPQSHNSNVISGGNSFNNQQGNMLNNLPAQGGFMNTNNSNQTAGFPNQGNNNFPNQGNAGMTANTGLGGMTNSLNTGGVLGNNQSSITGSFGRNTMTGGLGSMTGGQGSMTGGQGSITGGLGNMTGGLGNMTGGQGSMTGGQGSMTGGLGNMTGGLGNMTGGLGNMTGGQGSMTGGLGNMTGGNRFGTGSSLTSQTNMGFNNQNQGMTNQASFSNQKEAEDFNEISQVLDNYYRSFDSRCQENKFVETFFNFVPEGFSAIEMNNLANANLIMGNEKFIDLKQLRERQSENPDSSILYAFQVSSPKELADRMTVNERLLFEKLRNVNELTEQNQQLQQKIKQDGTGGTVEINEQRKKLHRQQARISTKLDSYAVRSGKAKRDFKKESQLLGKLQQMKSYFEENLMSKVEELNSLTNRMDNLKNSFGGSNQLLKKQNKEKVRSTMENIKLMIDKNREEMEKNMLLVSFMRSEMANLHN